MKTIVRSSARRSNLGRVDGKVTLEVHTERAAPVEAFDVAGQDGATTFGVPRSE